MDNKHGYFSGNPKTEWLAGGGGEDRDMKLLEDFSYTDPAGRVWLAPKGAIINGASIPRPLWPVVGSPYTDRYRRASIVHDVAYGTSGVSRKEADEMFFHACRAGGCSWRQASTLYTGVRVGGWAYKRLAKEPLSREALSLRKDRAVPTPEERFVQEKMFEILHDMESLPEEAPLEAIDAIIEQHLDA